jgi:formamidopyrimidine-DNA glycosylase
MPELPEVETVVRDLRPLLRDRTILSLRKSDLGLRRGWQASWEPLIVGRSVAALYRRGKWILVELYDGAFLMVHLGMTGQFTVTAAGTPVESHTHLVFDLDNDTQLRFRDVRRFGSVNYYPDRPAWETFLADRLGPEPWDMTVAEWRKRLKKIRRNLKATLLDQTLIAGVGNIYADESCFASRLNPKRKASALRGDEADRLLNAIQSILTDAVESRGSSIRNYIGGSGLRGGYQDEFCVYGREGQPCPACAEPITRIVLAGRATHFCKRCQR